jgi:diaminohydroxyphosphoribosylaminopyrimidine deaminase/5-amino-6-(5-phosphoribosylamino)uracil reductase
VRLYCLAMNRQEQYMQRCIELALKGAGSVAPNPMVGAVLVYNDTIIGEGWHQQYGEAHAEVNCILSVKEEDKKLIPQSTIYVSLEPCAHYGKTPPCADLIISQDIPEVVIGCTDSFHKVAGEGIRKLKEAGVEVTNGLLEAACRQLNKRFFTNQEQQRPYVILKWAQSADGFIAPPEGKKVMLSNELSRRYVHKMRSEESAILVGYHTARLDDPELSNRVWTGAQPVRVVLDPDLQLPDTLQLFKGPQKTIVINNFKEGQEGNVRWIKTVRGNNFAKAILESLGSEASVIIEGGTKTLQLFIDAGLWDEAVVIQTPVVLQEGTPTPQLNHYRQSSQLRLGSDCINHYNHEYTR